MRNVWITIAVIVFMLFGLLITDADPVYADDTTDQVINVSMLNEDNVVWGDNLKISAEYTLKFRATYMVVTALRNGDTSNVTFNMNMYDQEYDEETHHGSCKGRAKISSDLKTGSYRIESVTLGYYTDGWKTARFEPENMSIKVTTSFGDVVFDKTYYDETLGESLAALQDGDMAVIRCEQGEKGKIVKKAYLDAIREKKVTLLFPLTDAECVCVNGKDVFENTRETIIGISGWGIDGAIDDDNWDEYGDTDETYEIRYDFTEDGELPGFFSYCIDVNKSLINELDGDFKITNIEKVMNNLIFDYISLGRINPDNGESITYNNGMLTFRLRQTVTVNEDTRSNMKYDVNVSGIEDKAYTGSEVKQIPVLKYNGATLCEGVDYDIDYENNVNEGLAMINIRGKGNFGGRYVELFRISTEAPEITSLTAGNKTISVVWKEVSGDADGYQLQYSTSKFFDEESTRTIVISDKATTSRTIKELTSGRYYIRIRSSMIRQNETSGVDVKYYSLWSAVKAIDVSETGGSGGGSGGGGGGGGAPATDDIQGVVDLINAIPTPATVKDADAVKAARDAYDKLTSEQKDDPKLSDALIKKLKDAEEAVKSGQDQVAASNVSKEIAAIPDDLSKATSDQVSGAVEAYNRLTDDQKKLITTGELEKLQTALNYPATKLKVTLKSVKAKKGKKAVVKWKANTSANAYQLYYKAKGLKAKKVIIDDPATVTKTIKKLKAGKKYSFKIRTITKVENLSEPGTSINVYGKWSKTKKAMARK